MKKDKEITLHINGDTGFIRELMNGLEAERTRHGVRLVETPIKSIQSGVKKAIGRTESNSPPMEIELERCACNMLKPYSENKRMTTVRRWTKKDTAGVVVSLISSIIGSVLTLCCLGVI